MQVVAAICCILATPVARAQTPAETTAIDAFLAVRGWLDRDALPSLESDEARVALPETAAIAVLLRVDGRVVGRGEDATGDALMARRAAGRAVTEALGDTTIRAVRAELGDRVTARLSLEIELAGPTRPLLGRTVSEAAARTVPGSEGIALLKGDEVFRAFPSRLLANDSADRPDATITALMRAAGLPAQELRDFGPADRVSLGRFDTIRLRQGTPKSAPSVVVRGGRSIGIEEITQGFTRVLAAQLAARLAGQVVRLPTETQAEPGTARWGLLGTYNPTADAYDPAFAGPRDEAFAALALASASRCGMLPDATRAKAADSARHLVEALCARGAADRSDASDAMTLLTLRLCARTAPESDGDGLEERVRRSAEATRSLLTGREGAPAPQMDATTLETAAIATAALTAPGSTTDEHALAGSLVDALLSTTASSRGRLADGMLPLGMALRSGRLPAGSRDTLRSALEELAAVLDTLQLLPSKPAGDQERAASAPPAGTIDFPEDFPEDLLGGFALPGARAILADAQGLRLGAALALLRGSEKAGRTPEPSVLAAVRFLAQHVADEPWTDGFRRPEVLRGLVRASLASDDCPPAATAAGLLLAVGALPAGDALPAATE